MLPVMKHKILANMKVKLMTTYISRGSAATDLRRGGSFNSSFFHRCFLNNSERNMKIGPLLPKLS